MKFNIKKNQAKYFATILALGMTVTGCSFGGTAKEIRPNPEMSLRVATSTSVLNTGGIAKPWSNINFTTSRLWRNLFFATAGSLDVEPDLAEYYEISEDACTYEIFLRDDMVWEDGEVLDAEDVIFSIESLILLSTEQAVYTMFTTAFMDIVGAEDFINNPEGGISGMTASDDNTRVTITLNGPNNLFIQVLSQFAILPEHGFTGVDKKDLFNSDVEFWTNPICSSMYKMGEFVQGEYLEYVYNDKYPGEAPYINSIVLRSDYELEELHYTETNDVSLILDNRAIPNNTEHVADSIFYRYFVFNIDKGGEADPVLSDVRVRRAFTYAIDREAIVKNIYYGIGEVNNTGAVQTYDEPLDVDYEYNPEKALELLEEANYDFDRPVTLLYYYSDDISIKFMEEVGKYLEEIGLKVDIIKGTLYVEEYDHYDIGLKGLAVFSIVDWYNEYLSTSALHKDIFGGEPLFDDLIKELNQAKNEEERISAINKLQLLEYETLYKYPVFVMGHMAYTSDEVILPEGVVFGDSKYRYDLDFLNWKIDI